MAEIAKLVGMERREYVKDGVQRVYCGLHLLFDESNEEGFKGQKVEQVSCPRKVDPYLLELGRRYELVYKIYDMRDGKAARLVDFIPVE